MTSRPQLFSWERGGASDKKNTDLYYCYFIQNSTVPVSLRLLEVLHLNQSVKNDFEGVKKKVSNSNNHVDVGKSLFGFRAIHK